MVKIKNQRFLAIPSFFGKSRNKAQIKNSKSFSSTFFPGGKKAQMKIQQMAFMVVAIMVFFGLVGMLILRFQFSGLEEKATDLNKKNAMLLVSRIADSPEFYCAGSSSCIDYDKAILMKGKVEKYEGFWGDIRSLKIRKIYPESDGKIECDKNNYDKCNTITILEGSGIPAENFVSLCRREYDNQGTYYDKCEIAKIYISYERIQ